MKNFLIFFLLFFGFSFFYSQTKEELSEIEVLYDYSFLLDTLDVYSKKSEKMILLISKNSSAYYSYDRQIEDSLNIQILKNNLFSTTGATISAFTNIFAKVYKKDNEITVTDRIRTTDFYYIPEKSIDWDLSSSDAKNIGGYSCKKAKTKLNGKTYTAWFAPEIPFNDGPYRFKGLPGLILELYDDKGLHSFELISIKKKKSPIKFDNRGLKILQSEFVKKRAEFMKDPAGYSGQIVNKERRQMMYENVNKRNNFLE